MTKGWAGAELANVTREKKIRTMMQVRMANRIRQVKKRRIAKKMFKQCKNVN